MKQQHSFKTAALISLAFITIISCNKSESTAYNNNPPPGGGGPPTVNINISYMSFSPASKTVAKGTIVKWTNTDNALHTVTSDDGVSFDSRNIAGADNYNGGGTYSYTASVPGTFEYHCSIHGRTMMSGTLIVNP